jgi:plastocyanin
MSTAFPQPALGSAPSPGNYNYFCSIHPKMTGDIVVE